MSAVVGIDLGTTNTVVAHVEGQRAVALPDENGVRLIPSVVSFHPSGQVIVGRTAKERRLIDARNTVYSIKRLIGRAWASEDVRRAKERSPFELREGPGHAVLVVARGETYTLSEISAYVLRKAKAVAEAALGTTVDRAVITVPANFNDLQRAATKVAGRVAGLEVMRILNEPTAAALAYGYGKSNAERIAVYDFGGGTFDVTLLDLSGNVFEVLATAGDTFLGGDDVDLLIADKMCEAFLREHRYDPRTDAQVFERVRAAAEELKHALSTQPQVSIDLKEITFGAGGKALGLHFTMTQAELDKLIRPLVERSFAVCRDAITTARMNPKDFDQVILVGGSTRIPLVRDRVAEFFGREPLANVSPDEVVAIGAAIQAMALNATDRRRTTQSVVSEMPEDKTAADRQKVPTLGGLGETARQAQRAGVKTAGGLGEQSKQAQRPVKTDGGLGDAAKQAQRAVRAEPGAPQVSKTNPGPAGAPSLAGPLPTPARGLGKPRDPRVDYEGEDERTMVGEVLPIVVPTAYTERAPSTAGFVPSSSAPPLNVVSAFSPELTPQPARPPAANLHTKLSLGAEAKAALERKQPGEPPPRGAGRTEDSVMASLPLIGVGVNRAETLSEADAAPTDAPLPPMRTQPLEHHRPQDPLAFDLLRGAPIPTAPDDWEDQPTPFATREQLEASASGGPGGQEASFEGPTKIMDRLPSQVAIDAGVPPQPRLAPAPTPPAHAPPPIGKQTLKLDAQVPPPPPARPPSPSVSREGGPPPPPARPRMASVPREPPPPPPARPPPIAEAHPGTTTAAMPVPDLAPAPGMQQRFGLSSGRNISVPPEAPAKPRPAVPLLLDVTPLSLCVETVGGYCDVIISRNTPIPCDGTRVFVTAQSFQKVVRVRVAQGESARFLENTQLGEVELSGLREALRGEVEISVTFELDSDGLLQVRARDSATGHEAQARLRFIGAQDPKASAESRARQDRQVVV